MAKFFRIPWATSGDKTTVPDATETDGSVSYTEGYGSKYSLPLTDPDALKVERDKMNKLFYDMTNAIRTIQTQGAPDWISSSDNGGTAFSYGINAIVRYTDGAVYRSKAGSNTALPTDTDFWVKISDPTAASQGGTGQTSYSIGDMLYASAASVLARLIGNTTTTKKFLTQTGTGSASAAPSWDAVTTSDIPEGSNFYYTNARVDAVIAAIKGVANGLAGLDASGFVPQSQLPFMPEFDGDNTGATDVGAAINAWAASHNGIVLLRDGIYKLTTPVDPAAGGYNLFLIGKGANRTQIIYAYDVKDDAGNVCAAISYNGKLGSSGYATTSAQIGDSQTAVAPLVATITGVSSSSSLPTVTTAAAHNLASGSFVNIAGITATGGSISGMFMAILDSSTTTTTFRLYTINGLPYDTSAITYVSGGTSSNYFNSYSALTVNAANGDYLYACDVASAAGYNSGDRVHIHSQDDYLAALAEGRFTGEENTVVFVDYNANRLYLQRQIAFAHLYRTSPLITRFKGTQKVYVEGISFINDALGSDPLEFPFSVDPSSNVSSAIDIIGVVRPVVRDCDFTRCWGTAVRFITCPEFIHYNNNTNELYNADVYNNVVEKDVTGLTSATPPVMTTATTHGVANGNPVVIRSIVGTTEANNMVFQARNVNAGARTFELYDMNGNPVNGSTWTAYISGGKVSIANVRRLGYGVSAYGASSGVVSGGVYKNGRHPFTTDGKSGISYAANKWFLIGQPTRVLVKDMQVFDPWGPALDTHEEGRWIRFQNISVYSPTRSPNATDTYAVGMAGQIRCLDAEYVDCHFRGGKQQIRLANTSHSIQPITKFKHCSFEATRIVETSSGNKEGAIIIDSSEATTNPYWPQAIVENCVFDDVGVAIYMSGVSAVNVNSKSKLYNCILTSVSAASDCGAGTSFEMHGGVIDYSNNNRMAGRRRAVAYCSKLRDDATAAVGATSILNGVTIIRGATTNFPASIFERTTSGAVNKNFWARNCTIINPSNLSGALPMLSTADANMVEVAYISSLAQNLGLVSTDVGNIGTGEDNLQTFTIPAGTLYQGRAVKISAWGTYANNANAKTLKLYFGSLAIASQALTISQSGSWKFEAVVTSTGTNTQDYSVQLLQGGTVTAINVASGTTTQNTTSSIVIKCTGDATTNNDIVQEGLLVTLV